jgi:hypothetical protein
VKSCLVSNTESFALCAIPHSCKSALHCISAKRKTEMKLCAHKICRPQNSVETGFSLKLKIKSKISYHKDKTSPRKAAV